MRTLLSFLPVLACLGMILLMGVPMILRRNQRHQINVDSRTDLPAQPLFTEQAGPRDEVEISDVPVDSRESARAGSRH